MKGQMLDVFQCRHVDYGPETTALNKCLRCPGRRMRPDKDARQILLTNHLCPGDVLVMTAAVECLHEQHPGKFVTGVQATAGEAIFKYNPFVTPITLLGDGAEVIDMGHGHELINYSSQRPVHFLQEYTDRLTKSLGVPVVLTRNRSSLYVSREERNWFSQVRETGEERPFWIVNAGVKPDYTCKGWGRDNYQAVVDMLQGQVLFTQVGEAYHLHEPLDGVVNLVGRTDTRQLIRLAWNAYGGLGPTTFLQHVMAAFSKPYTCILGGRESHQWSAYPMQQTFHTIGMLDCCRSGGCWRSRVKSLGDGDTKDQSLCKLPVGMPGRERPACMEMVRPERVAEAILAMARAPTEKIRMYNVA